MVLVGWLLVFLAGRRLTAVRTLTPEQPTAGDDVKVSVRVRNESLVPGPQVTVTGAGGDLEALDGTLEIESLRPRAERTAAITISPARRGRFHLPELHIETEDPLGLARARRATGEPQDVTIYPSLVHLETCAALAHLEGAHERGARGLPRLGGSELRGIRPHYPGEPLSHVDWKATARTGSLMLREMDDPGGSDICLVLDGTAAAAGRGPGSGAGSSGVPGGVPATVGRRARRSAVARRRARRSAAVTRSAARRGDGPDPGFEVAVQVAGSIADAALRGGRDVDLLLHEAAWRRVALKRGRQSRRRLLEALATAAPSGTVSLAAALGWLDGRDRRRPRAQSWVVVVRSLDAALARALSARRREGPRIVVVLVHGSSSDGGPDRSLLLSLAAADVPCLTVKHDDDLAGALSLDPARDRLERIS